MQENMQNLPSINLSPRIFTVAEFLADCSLTIPPYQRPYKWTTKNVRQLFDDLAAFTDKTSYRLGTIVFHEEDGKRNIVDGQQRTVTLLLAARALLQRSLKRKDLSDQLALISKAGLTNQKFKSEISKFNIYTNYREIDGIVSQSSFTEEMVDFLLNKCEVVTISLREVSEAFQFFDSQNARGRDLEPHDLLKAYHLREFNSCDREMQVKAVADWEDSETRELTSLFAEYLYRIRNWSRGVSARHFGKADVPLFKGVNLDRKSCHPYVVPLQIAHHFVDQYNGQYERKINGDVFQFPFQLDQMIINGRRFFEMIAHYRMKVAKIARNSDQIIDCLSDSSAGGFASKIMKTINDYPGMHRSGDRYVRGLFDCLLIYYCDKFGDAGLAQAIEKVFIWAYTVRLQMRVLQFATVDNYVRDTRMFQKIKDAISPHDFLRSPLPMIPKNRSYKTEAIFDLFLEMGGLE